MIQAPTRWFGPLVVVLMMVMAFTTVARGDDVNPPPWRGMPLGVEGHWDIQTNNWDVHVYNRPVPNPNEHMWQEPPQILINPNNPNEYWINFPNWVDEEPLKIGRIQIYWLTTGGTTPPILTGLAGFDGPSSFTGAMTDQGPIPGSPSGAFGWYFDFAFQPNPDWEQICFLLPPGSLLTQLDIDTASIPEPASIALIAMGSLAMIRRRRD